MTRRMAAVALAIAVLTVWVSRLDVRRLLGPLKGDEATFVSMAFSLAEDGDLKYRREDYQRFRAIYGTGPEGIFLKQSNRLEWRVRGGWPPIEVHRIARPTSDQLDYGKPFAYAVAAAPFAAALGLDGL